MLRSLYSAVTGLKNHQTKMDVLGNNISNVNTTGFKRSRVNFVTMLSQTMKGASSPTATQGGTNAVQVGLGSMIGAIDQITTQGSSQTTGKETDLMLQGSGFFVLKNNGVPVYTRSGAFGFDSQGFLVDPATGAKVQGYMWSNDDTTTPNWTSTQTVAGKGPGFGDISFTIGEQLPGDATFLLDSYSIDPKGIVTGVYSDGTSTKIHKIAQIAVSKFKNDAGLTNLGNGFLSVSGNSGDPDIGAAGEKGRAVVIPGALEMSNVDLSQEFTDMIVTQRGFQANSRVITTSDTLLEELINLKR